MPRLWYATDLSVNPPSKEIGTTGIYYLPFTYDPEGSGLTATAATCRLVNLATLVELDEQPEISAVAENACVVTVDVDTLGLVRGERYELLVSFTLSNDEIEPGTLVLEVVA
jgi:hypothetical protein